MNILITGACGHIGSHLAENIYKIKKIKKYKKNIRIKMVKSKIMNHLSYYVSNKN